jgi:acetyl/propionyl-CoA carboxylase alpha subunit/acetyl-CoA carboxylase carboxyltransferase component
VAGAAVDGLTGRRLLIANRAEIATRIIDTARALGLTTMAVAPVDDRDCGHCRRADSVVLLPGSGPAAYLDIDAITAAAQASAAEFVHPGYGFLAENAALARAISAAGAVFVGPDATALDRFGDKVGARTLARSLGIPVAAATDVDPSAETATAFQRAHGAVLVKAVAGGGGRGQRVVTTADELAGAIERAANEAATAFGDRRIYLEQRVEAARHIEVQVLGDGHDVVVLGDRDCSLQRRRQKLIEVAPAELSVNQRTDLEAAALALTAAMRYRGLGTVEFLVTPDAFVFLEVNPRIQVEHTVTEQVTGLDLVEVGLRIAAGARLADLGLATRPASRGFAVEARINTELVSAIGDVLPQAGRLTGFVVPTGPGIRVDTHAYAGYDISPRYDSLLAKVITAGPTLPIAARRAAAALADLEITGVVTNRELLRTVLDAVDLGHVDTGWFDRHVGALTASPPAERTDVIPAVDGVATVSAPLLGTVVAVAVAPGDIVAAGAELVVVESMKMEHDVCAPSAGTVLTVSAAVGTTVSAGRVLLTIAVDDAAAAPIGAAPAVALDHRRPDLARAEERHRRGRDEGRPDAVARRHRDGRRTARENIADLVDDGSFVEYGALVIAAQRQRRTLEDLIDRTPADGLVLGTATVDGAPIAVLAYDYTVLAGTQGVLNHRKTDRLLDLATRAGLPVVMFTEGGGGRPGDTDTTAVAQLDVTTFRLAARLSGQVPSVAIVSGYCFAGNAALAGVCDLIIATPEASLGMGGPAMIEGGGLGVVAPEAVGPMSVQVPNGVVDILADDEAGAVAAARHYLGLVTTPVAADAGAADQRTLRPLVPENRVRAYDVGPVLDGLFDTGSRLELRPEFGVGVQAGLARLAGRTVGYLASNPRHLGGAIDGDAADKAAGLYRLCQARGLPVVSLVDTPGFMVGPEVERTGAVRRFGALFVAGAALTTPIAAVVLRKAYGLGAIAMTGGDLRAPVLTVAWPSGEFGGMGLEGAVTLGYRSELDAIADPAARRARFDELVAGYYERGQAISAAMAFEIDDVIDPADTRSALIAALARAVGA